MKKLTTKEEKAKLDNLFNNIQQAKASKDDRLKAIKDINQKYANYTPKLVIRKWQ